LERELVGRGCEVHLFTLADQGMVTASAEGGVTLHPFSMHFITDFKHKQVTLSDIMTYLNHTGRTIHLLKLDQGELANHIISEQLATADGTFVLDQVEQIAGVIRLPTHLQGHLRRVMTYAFLKQALGLADELGFRLVSSVPLGQTVYRFPGVETPVHAEYQVLMVRIGRDVMDRKDRYREMVNGERIWTQEDA